MSLVALPCPFRLVLLALAPGVLCACAGRSPSVADPGPVGPSLAFVGLPASVGCDADADAEADGFQLDVGIELLDDDDSGFGAVALANARNNATASGTLSDGLVSLSIEVEPAAAPGVENTLTASASNEAGRALSVSAAVTVACDIPPPSVSCSFDAPSANAVLSEARVDVALVCSAEGLNAAQRAWFGSAQLRVDALRTADGSTRSQELDLVGGSAAGEILLVGSGVHTLTATVLDPDELLDPDPSTTITVDVQP